MGNFPLDNDSLRRIEVFLPRLKYSLFPNKIISWLNNFEDGDMDLAMDLLLLFEYISFNELQFRFDDLLRDIIKGRPPDEKIIIIPYGRVGKSGSMMTYLIRNTSAFKKGKKNILLSHDYRFIDAKNYDTIIFMDDFVGSGKTFCDEYKDVTDIESWVKNNGIKNVFLLCAVIMVQAKERIKSRFPYIEIRAEERHKIFHPSLSPFKSFKNMDKIEAMAKKYGESLTTIPYGFQESQSLLSFFFRTPNNTLPIFWIDNENWTSLYPRDSVVKMNLARMQKKEFSFIIGVYNRLSIDLYDNGDISIEKANGKKRIIKYNTKEHFAIIGLLTLKEQRYEDIQICHILGLTMKELSEIYSSAIKFKLLHSSRSFTPEGLSFLKEIRKVARKEKVRAETDKNLTPKDIVYVPEQFKGLT